MCNLPACPQHRHVLNWVSGDFLSGFYECQLLLGPSPGEVIPWEGRSWCSFPGLAHCPLPVSGWARAQLQAPGENWRRPRLRKNATLGPMLESGCEGKLRSREENGGCSRVWVLEGHR